MDKYIAAVIAHYGVYPPFLNATLDTEAGMVRLTFRADPGGATEDTIVCGPVTVAHFHPEEWAAFLKMAIENG